AMMTEGAAAVPLLQKYLATYPKSDWAWIATLRLGAAEEKLGDLAAAAASYASISSDLPPARVLAGAAAARAHAGLGQIDRALEAYRQALRDWDDDFGPMLVLDSVAFVERSKLPGLIARLERSAKLADRAPIERARWAIEHGRPDDALAALKGARSREAREMAHRARLERALALADIENPKQNEVAAMAELEALAREPFDFGVCAAEIARATMLWRGGEGPTAEAILRAAGGRWAARPAPPPRTPLERDVAAIRAEVFRPRGDGIFAGHGSWNGFEFPLALPPFVIARAEIRVKLPNGDVVAVATHAPKALVLDDDQIALLARIMNKLGGTKTRPWVDARTTPNQPVGPSLDASKLRNRFFAMRSGHWGGWVLETYPIIDSIELGPDSALAAVQLGYGGATVVLAKKDGRWRALRLVNEWVT